MVVYIPVYDNGWKTAEIETEKARIRKSKLDGSSTIIYYGTIYNGENIFNDPAAVDMWIAKNYHESQKYAVNADTVKWSVIG